MGVSKGFTLLELAVTLAIVAILLVAGAPSMQTLLLDSRRSRVVNELVRALHAARAESLRSSADVVLCPADDHQSCVGSQDAWRRGWMVFINSDGDDPPVRDEDERVILHYALDHLGDVAANRTGFVYRPFGRRSTTGTLVYCDRRGATGARAVIVSHTGRPRVSSLTASGTPLVCPG